MRILELLGMHSYLVLLLWDAYGCLDVVNRVYFRFS